jgi:response regulator RpfG family c-di-GMP phosphodiesterase
MRRIGGKGIMQKGIEILPKVMDIGLIGLPTRLHHQHNNIGSDKYLVEAHVKIGHELLMSTQHEFYMLLANFVLHHHENFDGTGYPHQLKGTAIPLESRIARVAKDYESLYNKHLTEGLSSDQSKELTLNDISLNSGIIYDPNVVSVLNDILQDSFIS